MLQRLAQGQRVAYVSDAGTPAVSDPGAVLVAAVAAAGHRVLPLPGPSSALAALSVAGDAHASGFGFVGFLPPRAASAAARWQRRWRAPGRRCCSRRRTASKSWRGAGRAAPQRRVTLCRELTKQFETVATLAAAECRLAGRRRQPRSAASSCWCCTRPAGGGGRRSARNRAAHAGVLLRGPP